MHSSFRRIAALFGAAVLLSLAAPAAGATPRFHVHELRMPAGVAASRAVKPVTTNAAPNACNDNAYKLLGAAQQGGSYAWSFHAASTPSYLNKSSVLNVLQKSFSNITNASNDCGLADTVDATHNYLGTTSTRAKCGSRDSRNIIGFRQLEYGVLAVTCYWTSGGRIVEADMQITTRETWALSVASCSNDMMLEATITHEAGHVYGMDHVSERRHGRLTMSPFSDGPCDNSEASLGWGDIRGLGALY